MHSLPGAASWCVCEVSPHGMYVKHVHAVMYVEHVHAGTWHRLPGLLSTGRGWLAVPLRTLGGW